MKILPPGPSGNIYIHTHKYINLVYMQKPCTLKEQLDLPLIEPELINIPDKNY